MKTLEADICIIGAGPAGLLAAIAAGKEDPGLRILLLDKKDRAGNKIYATGNGRCNLTNKKQTPECYHSDSCPSPVDFLPAGAEEKICSFFEEGGVLLHDRDGYVYPATDQAATIALFLVHRAEDSGVRILTGTTAVGTARRGPFFVTDAESGKVKEKLKIQSRALVLAAGGMVSKAFGDTGDGYRFAQSLGHHIVAPIPALTYLSTSTPGMKVLSGTRCHGKITLKEGGRTLGSETGELQFTDGALSGIPAFQLSRIAGRCLEKKRSISAEINFIPSLSISPEELLDKRLSLVPAGRTAADLFLGLAGSRVTSFLLRSHGIADEKKIRGLSRADLLPVFRDLFSCTFPVTGTGSFEKAQATAGGIRLDEVSRDTMESRITPGLFPAGEVLDLDGICGGYNLTFAFTSGWTAGRHAAQYCRKRKQIC